MLDVSSVGWCRYLLAQDYIHQYATLFLGEVYFNSCDLHNPETRASNLLAKILPMLQGNLEDPIRATTDPTITVILGLAIAAEIFGDLESMKKHVQGLSTVVAMRGGITNITYSELQFKCCR
jgi:hypothetical protein